MNGNNFRKSNEKGSEFIEMRRHKQSWLSPQNKKGEGNNPFTLL